MISAVRAIFFYIGYIVAMLVISLLAPVSLLLPLRARSWLITRFNWFVLIWLRLTCGIRVVVEGSAPKPGERQVVC